MDQAKIYRMKIDNIFAKKLIQITKFMKSIVKAIKFMLYKNN